MWVEARRKFVAYSQVSGFGRLHWIQVNVLLVSTYDLGHQPFGLASPSAWLARDGHTVRCMDLAVEPFSTPRVQAADLVAFYLPMHTATRLALPVIERVKRLNPAARLVCYGLYAPLNSDLLRGLGVEAILGGEFELSLAKLARGEQYSGDSIDRLEFIRPDRGDLPEAASYAHLHHGDERKQVAYTEASRGCKHMCRHCPVVPVYQGHFRVVQREVVLEDIRSQVAAGARHVTFGDPDFFNGPTHAMKIVEALHAEFPDITYDAIIKIEHLLKHRDLLRPLRDTGCLFVTSAVESVDDRVLLKLEKNHTRKDFFEALALAREADLTLQPTFIAFTPWTTIEGYRDLLNVLADLDLVENVGSVQLALRLLVTSGSRLLELDDVQEIVGPFDQKSLVYPWVHPDPEVDTLSHRVFRRVAELQKQGHGRTAIFREIVALAGGQPLPDNFDLMPRATIPYLDEPWYC
jgi:radical SAM superfamily enzyme YgiQ (UPF0313 family)